MTARLPTCDQYIDGRYIRTAKDLEVTDKYLAAPFMRVSVADAATVDAAVAAAHGALQRGGIGPAHRADILHRAADWLLERRDDIGGIISREVGKPVEEGRWEVDWTAGVFHACAEETLRLHGEMVPIQASPGCENGLAFTLRVPVGVVAAITPFNYPLNQGAHKIAPALGAGNAVVHKPSPNTPVSAMQIVRALDESGLPAGWLNVVHGGADVGQMLASHPGVDFISFTGSVAAGRAVQQAAGLRRTAMELGSISAVIVHADADLDRAVQLCAAGAFSNAGQVCISVQRLVVHEALVARFCERLVLRAQAMRVGDPADPGTHIGPMISVEAAERAEAWVAEAVAGGARILTGGRRLGALLWPTVLIDVKPDMKVVAQEIFAPVVVVIPYRTIGEAFATVMQTPYGLQTGIFTADLAVAMDAARQLRVGGVIVNDTCAFRRDVMPYGGVRGSGFGREGPRYAMEEMTDTRTVVVFP